MKLWRGASGGGAVHLSARERTVVVVGSLGILAMAAIRVTPVATDARATAIRQAADRVQELALVERSIAALPDRRDSLQHRRQRLEELGPMLLGGGSPAGAAAALAAQVTAAAGRSGMELGAIELHVDTAAPSPLQAVSVRATAIGEMPDVVRFFQDLEREPPLLAVREWAIAAADAVGAADLPGALRVDFRVEGLALRPRPTGSP